MILLFSSVLITIPTKNVKASDNWTVSGDTVFINDSNVFLSASPHTLNGDGWVYFNLTTKFYDGDIDVCWGFDEPDCIPTKAQIWCNYSHEYRSYYLEDDTVNIPFTDVSNMVSLGIENYDNYFVDFGNTNNTYLYGFDGTYSGSSRYYIIAFSSYSNSGTNYLLNCHFNAEKFSYANKTFYDWIDWDYDFEVVNYNYGGMNTWYIAQDLSVIHGVNYSVRAYIDIPFAGFEESSGKYWWCLKPSDRTISQAVSDGSFYSLDPWWSASWTYKKEITIKHSEIDADVTHFPVLINITDTDLRDDALNNGDDIVFTASNQVTQLNHEIEEYDGATGHLTTWVNVTSLSSSVDTSIYMYYGNSGAANQEHVTATWHSNYVGVWHMNDASTQVTDSTNNQDGSPSSSPTYGVHGRVGDCVDFDGTDYFSITNNIYKFTGDVIGMYWQYYDSSPEYSFTFGMGDADLAPRFSTFLQNAGNNDKLAAGIFNTATGWSATTPQDSDNNAWAVNSWRFISIKAYENDQIVMYRDSVRQAAAESTGTWDLSDCGGAFSASLGDEMRHSYNMEGKLDEIRFYTGRLSTGYLNTTYNTMNKAYDGGFFTIGSEEISASNNIPVITNPNPANNSVNIVRNPILSITVNDYDGDIMNLSFYTNASGGWLKIDSNLSISNGTYTCKPVYMENYNTKYYWNVSVNDGTAFNNSDIFGLTIEDSPDITVSNPDPVNNSDALQSLTSVSIDINSNNIFNYTIELGGSAASDNAVTNNTFSLNGLSFSYSTFYKWYVNVTNGNKSGCYYYGFTTSSSVSIPSDMQIDSYNSTSINLSWTKGTGTSNTYIRHKKGSYPTSRTDGTLTINATGNSFNHTGLDIGTVYYYRSWGYNSTLGEYSVSSVNKSNTTAPLKPTSVLITSTTTSINLSWTKGTNATNTVIRRNASGNSNYPNLNIGTEVYNNTGVYFVDNGLSSNTTYYYTIWSYQPSHSVFSFLNETINKTTGNPANSPTNISNNVLDYNSIILNWTKGSSYTVIRRNTGSLPTLSTGTEVYNSTGDTYTDIDLTAITHYYYRLWGWNGTYLSDTNITTDNITFPAPPQNFTGVYSGTTYSLTWSNGTGCNTTMIRNETGLFPSYNSGNEVYNGTTPSTTDTQTDSDNLQYYRAWTYAFIENRHLYSIPVDIVFGSLEINVYKETQPHISISNYTIFITNQQGSETYINTSANNPTNINVADVPNGESVSIQISKTGYHTRVKTIDLLENEFYIINFYLPSDIEGGGDPSDPDYIPPEDEDNNESYSYQYLLNVVDYHNNPIEDAKLQVKRYINTTDSYEDVSIRYTDTNGQVDIYLVPETIYKFEISKQYYLTEHADYIPSKSIFSHTFRLYYETTETTDTETVLDGIIWTLKPDKHYWNNSFTLYYNISNSNNNLEYFILNITFYNATSKTWDGLNHQNISDASGGSLSYTFANITGKYRVSIFFKKTNFSLYEIPSVFFWIEWGGISESEALKAIPDWIYFCVLIIIAMIVMAFLISHAGLGTGYIGIAIIAFGLILNPSLSVGGVTGWAILVITTITYSIGIFLWSKI